MVIGIPVGIDVNRPESSVLIASDIFELLEPPLDLLLFEIL